MKVIAKIGVGIMAAVGVVGVTGLGLATHWLKHDYSMNWSDVFSTDQWKIAQGMLDQIFEDS